MQLKPIALAIPAALVAVLAGCASTNNYDSSQNPFEERKPAVGTQNPSSGPKASANKSRPPNTVTSIPVAVSSVPTTNVERKLSPSEQAHLDSTSEMIAEANRLGGTGDMENKAKLLEQAGYSGNAQAFYLLAKMHLDGSVPKDDSAMFGYISLAQGMGHVEATRVLGQLYLHGITTPQDISYGRLLLENAAESSSRAAMEYGELLANLSEPNLDDLALGIHYLQMAVEQGNRDAFIPLSKALEANGQLADSLVLKAEYETYVEQGNRPLDPPPVNYTLKDRAMRGDHRAIYEYASNVLIRKEATPEPEFTGYCWMAVAANLGSEDALRELRFIEGIRKISERRSPGRLDQCITQVQYNITGVVE